MEDIEQDAPASPATEQLARFLENDPRVAFPRRLREVRTQAHMTQQQLAGEMNLVLKMHRSAIAKIESGERPVLLGEAVAFANILNVSLLDLLRSPSEQEQESELMRARLTVEALRREAVERWRQFEDTKILLANSSDRLVAAQRRLAELEGEL
jgi:transcriptional regulator with XRE-family HTH domain